MIASDIALGASVPTVITSESCCFEKKTKEAFPTYLALRCPSVYEMKFHGGKIIHVA
jgi:hypothetical protein